MEKNRLVVVINSRQYTIVSSESQVYLEKLAAHVTEKVTLGRKESQNVMGERPVILAALNICDEYFKALEAGKVLQEQMQKCTDKLQEVNEENKRLQELIKESEYEIDIDAMQKQIVQYSKEISKLEAQLKQARSSKDMDKLKMSHKKELEELKAAHQKELADMKAEYERKEKEFLELIDKL